MTYRARNIGLALALGLGAAFLVTLYVHKSGRSSTESLTKKIASVFVASRDIAPGNPGQPGRRRDPRDAAAPRPASCRARSRARGRSAGAGLHCADPLGAAGDAAPVRARRRGGRRGRDLAHLPRLPASRRRQPAARRHARAGRPRRRARQHQVHAAGLQRGTGAEDPNAQQTLVASRVVLRDLLVLRAPEAPAGTGKFGATTNYALILRVTDTQAQKLFFVIKNGDWSLQLRPAHAAADSPGSVEVPGSILGDGLKKTPQYSELLTGSAGPSK